MTVLKILQYPDPRLKRKAVRVEDFGHAFQKVVDDMLDTFFATENCGALAATQLDIPEPVPDVTVIDSTSERKQMLCLVNAEIIERCGELYEAEGCMSVPKGVYEKIKRSKKIRVRAQDREGKPLDFEVDGGYFARCVQHELDHLKGVIFIDHLSRLKRMRVDKKLLAKE